MTAFPQHNVPLIQKHESTWVAYALYMFLGATDTREPFTMGASRRPRRAQPPALSAGRLRRPRVSRPRPQSGTRTRRCTYTQGPHTQNAALDQCMLKHTCIHDASIGVLQKQCTTSPRMFYSKKWGSLSLVKWGNHFLVRKMGKTCFSQMRKPFI